MKSDQGAEAHDTRGRSGPGGTKGRRGSRTSNRLFRDALSWMARSGGRWRDLPERLGDDRSVKRRYDGEVCEERNRIERFFSKRKQFRRVATRYDTLLANFMAS